MVFKEFLQKLNERKVQRKDKFREMSEDDKLVTLIEERKKSANQRELERYMNEDNEKMIKKQLEYARKKRSNEINSINCLNTPNITNHSDFSILKDKKLFVNRGNMFSNQRRVY